MADGGAGGGGDAALRTASSCLGDEFSDDISGAGGGTDVWGRLRSSRLGNTVMGIPYGPNLNRHTHAHTGFK